MLLPRYGRRAWRVLAPTGTGILFTVAVLGMIGQPVQLMHVLALLLLLGMGVDYGIFLEEAHGVRRARGWLAVVLASTSALLSFGLLGLSATPALHFFGVTMLIGIEHRASNAAILKSRMRRRSRPMPSTPMAIQVPFSTV